MSIQMLAGTWLIDYSPLRGASLRPVNLSFVIGILIKV